MEPFYHPVQLPLFVTSKTCSICTTEKSIDNFGKDPRYKNGYKAECNQCSAERRADYRRLAKSKRNKVNPNTMRTCANCGAEKMITEFVKRDVSKDGYGHKCQDCENARIREYESRNKEHIYSSRSRASC